MRLFRGQPRSTAIAVPLIVAVMIGVSIAGGLVLTEIADARTRAVRDAALAQAEMIVGIDLSWGAIRPSVLRTVSLRDVALSDFATARRVDVSIRLGALFAGRPEDLIPRVAVVDPVFTFDSPDDIRRFIASIRVVAERQRVQRNIAVSVQRGSIQYRQARGAAGLERVSAEVELSAAGLDASIAATVNGSTGGPDGPIGFSTRLETNLSGLRSGEAIKATVELSESEIAGLDLVDVTVRVERRGALVSVRRVRSTDPLDVVVTADLNTGIAELEVVAEAFAPEALLRTPPSGPQAFVLALPITTETSGSVNLETGAVSLEGTVSTVVRHPELVGAVRLGGAYRFSDSTVSVQDLRVASPSGGWARFTGNYHIGDLGPSGTLTLDRLRYGTSPPLSGAITVAGSRSAVGLSAATLEVMDTPVYRVSGTARRENGAFSLLAGFAVEENEPGNLSVELRGTGLRDLTGRIALERVRLAAAARIATATGIDIGDSARLPDLVVDGDARFDVRGEQVTIRLPVLVARDAEGATALSLSATYRDGVLDVERLFARAGSARVSGNVLVRIGSGGTIDVDSDILVNGIEYPIRALYSDRDGLTLLVGPTVELRLTRSSDGAIAIRGRLNGTPIPVGGARLSATVSGRWFSGSEWYIFVDPVTVEDLQLADGTAAVLSLAVSLNADIARIAILEAGDAVSTIAGTIELSYDTALSDGIRVDGLLGALNSREQYRLAGRYATGQFALDLRFSGSPLARFVPRLRAGTASGAFQATGTLDEPQLRLFVETDGLTLGEQNASATILAYLDGQVARITQTEVALGSTRINVDRLVLDRETGNVTGSALVARPDGRSAIAIDLTGLTGALTDLSAASLADLPIDLTIRSEPVDADRFIAESWSYRLIRAAGTTRITRADGAIRARLDERGEFELVAAEPLPFGLQAVGRVAGGDVEATVSEIRADLAEVAAWTGMQRFVPLRGTARGSLRVLGAAGDPDLFGTISVDNLRLRTPFSPAAVGPTDGTLIFEEKTVRLRETETRVGDAPAMVQLEALISRLALEAFRLRLSFPGEEGVRIVSDFGPVSVDGFARGTMVIEADRNDVSVLGEVDTYSTTLTIVDQEERDRQTGPAPRQVSVDLSIQTGRAVQFIWPDPDFPILRSNFATGQTVELAADTRAETFELTGTMEIQSGDIFYFDRNFLIRSGRIAFDEDESEFDPRLTARAELREATPEGPVRIYLVADGERLSDFSPRFESSPPLPGADIVAILGGNIFAQGNEGEITLSSALLSTSDIVTQFGVFRQFENDVRRALDLDLFAIRTSVLQNLLLTAISPADETAQELAPSLGTYLNDTSVFMGRYLGDSVFGQVLLQMRSRDFTEDEDDGIQRLGGVLIDSEISLEWQTPFFLLEWNLAPQNPEELFIRDNTFTLSWSFSY